MKSVLAMSANNLALLFIYAQKTKLA